MFKYSKAIVFGVVVVGAALASMKHFYDFAIYFNMYIFAYGFMLAMEAAFIGSTVVYSLEAMVEDEKKEKHQGNALQRLIKGIFFSKGKADLKTRTRNLLATCVGILFVLQYIINTFSSYNWLITHYPNFDTTPFAHLFFIPSDLHQYFILVISHMAGGILPFLAFFFSKAVALAVSEARSKKLSSEDLYELSREEGVRELIEEDKERFNRFMESIDINEEKDKMMAEEKSDFNLEDAKKIAEKMSYIPDEDDEEKTTSNTDGMVSPNEWEAMAPDTGELVITTPFVVEEDVEQEEEQSEEISDDVTPFREGG